MAKLRYLLLLLSLGSDVLSQNSSIAAISSSASIVASSAGGASSVASSAASAASSLASVGSSSAAASESSIAASASSVASSLASVASSISSVASSIASSIASSSIASSSRASSTIPIASTPSSSSSTTTSAETSSSVAPTSRSSSSPLSSSSSSTSTSEGTSTSTTASPSVFTTSSTFVSFSTSTIISTSVIPLTSNGVVGYTTVTTYIVSSAPAATYISPYTETSAPASTPTTQADASKSGGGGGLSTGAKIGIGVGVGLAVLAAAIFGGWYSWYMRRRRRRSITASDRYPPSSIPSMSGMMGGMAYQDKSDTRSELPSPPIGASGQYSPPIRSPDRLLPAGGGVRSWNSVSNSNVPTSSQSISDYSERGGQPPPDASDAQPTAGYVPPGGAIHEMPENQQHQNQISPQQQFSHNRTTSGESQPSELGEGTLSSQQRMPSGSPPPQHQRTMSGGSQNYQSPSQGSDGYWHNTENAHELSGTPNYLQTTTSRGEGYRGVDPEVPLHQRMQTERVPFRPGHLQKQPPGPNLPPSHNY